MQTMLKKQIEESMNFNGRVDPLKSVNLHRRLM